MLIAKGKNNINLNTRMINRHGLIAGATGSGKSCTLQTLAEAMSREGIPVFVADVKGDLAGMAYPGNKPKIQEIANNLGISDYTFEGNPVAFWDVYGSNGNTIKTTMSSMGVTILTRLLDLSDAQSGSLAQIFKIASDNGIVLRNVEDIRSMTLHLLDHPEKYESQYGRMAAVSFSTLQRSLLSFEGEGQDVLFDKFGKVFDITKFLRVENGRGVINILTASTLINSPRVYALFLLWLLKELFTRLPEVGDMERPFLAFFFDEAHLLFKDAPRILVDQVERLVKLIRSKGVGIYLATQNPSDIPDGVLNQLGNRIQHGMRAFTPREQKSVRTLAQTFRQNGSFDVEKTIMELRTGEALVSFLNTDGSPAMVERAFICPPRSRIGAI